MVGEGAPTSSSPNQSAEVCCMCGDHGLSLELFRCKGCIFRSQHKYCSDLYPKEEQYSVCNWCLREGGSKSFARESSNSVSSSSSNAATEGGGFGGPKLDLHTFSPQLDKPIKKRSLPKRSSSDVSEQMRPKALLPGTIGRGRQAFRGKARRYKLLEEVSM